VAVAPQDRPIRLVVRDGDLHRSRLTVFFRLLLALPHLVWLILWWITAMLLVVVVWIVAIALGRVPSPLHRYLAAYMRYASHVRAYLLLAANPFPGFVGRPGYPVEVVIDPPARQRRLTVLFRYPLALPAFVLSVWLVLFPVPFGYVATAVPGMVALVVAVFAWAACLVLGRMPRGLNDLLVYGIGYGAQVAGYFWLLTDRYPNADPELAARSLELHPVRAVVRDGLERSRLTVLFRLLLALPHLFWLTLWGIAALGALIAAWAVALVRGQVPGSLHRFLAAYIRYRAHVTAFITVVGGPFPGFVGAAGSYPVDIEIHPPARQHRAKTLFRLLLALPAAVIAYPLGYVLLLVAVGSWIYSLVLGRAPQGLRNLGVACIRYHTQLNTYLFLLTDHYPFASPALEDRREAHALPLATPALGETF